MISIGFLKIIQGEGQWAWEISVIDPSVDDLCLNKGAWRWGRGRGGSGGGEREFFSFLFSFFLSLEKERERSAEHINYRN